MTAILAGWRVNIVGRRTDALKITNRSSCFLPPVSSTPWKHYKISGFPIFSGDVERDHWHDIGELMKIWNFEIALFVLQLSRFMLKSIIKIIDHQSYRNFYLPFYLCSQKETFANFQVLLLTSTSTNKALWQYC